MSNSPSARSFDRRVVPDAVLDLVRALQRRATSHLAGGAALSGLYLSHRLSSDVDHSPEADLALALKKDAGIDPGVLAWLLRDFPTSPLPEMLVPLTRDELTRFRDELAERFRMVAVP